MSERFILTYEFSIDTPIYRRHAADMNSQNIFIHRL